MRKFLILPLTILIFTSCMSGKFLENADYDDIVSVYDSIAFKIWRDKDKSNALIKLIKIGSTDEALFLIEQKAFNLNYVNKKGETALSVAIKNENSDVIISLIEHGVSINNENIENPIFVAVMTGNTTIIDTLLKNGSDIQSTDKNGNSTMHYAVNAKNTATMVSYLLEKKVSIEHRNTFGETPLYYAIKHGKFEAADILIRNNADTKTLDDKKQNLYFAALEADSKDLLEFVEKFNKNINDANINNETPLFVAIKKYKADLIKKLIALGADIERSTDTSPLWYAFEKSEGTKTECLKVLAENGINLNRKNNDGQTVVIKSILDKNENLTFQLLQWGADPNLTDSKNIAPVQYAVDMKNSTILSYLISANADLSVRNKNGYPLLHTCVATDSKDLLELLLSSNTISVDYPATSGITAAMFAFQNSKPELGNYLIQKGASLTASDKNGKNLISYRKDYYQYQINNANKKIAENNSRVSSLLSQNSSASQKISSLRIDEQRAYNNYVQVNDEYESAKRQQDSLERDTNYAKSQMSYWESRVNEWTRLYNSATTASGKSSAYNGLSNAKSEYNSWKRTYNSKSSELLSMSIANAGKSVAATIAYTAYTKVSKQISEQNSIINSNNATIANLNSENSTLSQNIKNYQVEISKY